MKEALLITTKNSRYMYMDTGKEKFLSGGKVQEVFDSSCVRVQGYSFNKDSKRYAFLTSKGTLNTSSITKPIVRISINDSPAD